LRLYTEIIDKINGESTVLTCPTINCLQKQFNRCRGTRR